MRVHFFTSIELPYRSSFRSFYTLQNLQTVKAVSAIYFIANLFLRLLVVLNDLPIGSINHIDEYDGANWVSLAISPLFYLGSLVFIRKFNKHQDTWRVAQLFAVLFGLFILLSAMRSTFFVMHNPRNTLVLYFM